MLTKTEPLTYTEHVRFGRENVVHRILVIEYQDNRPFAVYTDHGGFDFDFCKRDGTLYFEDVGGGIDDEHCVHGFCNPSPPPGKIWLAPGIRLHRWESQRKPKVPIADDAELLAMGYVRLKRPMLLKRWDGKTRNPFDAAEESNGHLEYCSICEDRLPSDGLCDHLCWPDGGAIVGAGGDPPHDESMFAALDWLAALGKETHWRLYPLFDRFPDAVRALERLLLKNEFPPRHCSVGCDVAHLARDSEDWDDMDEAFAWLKTLGRDTPEANAKTLAWIMTWRLTRVERARAKERKALIGELQLFATDAQKSSAILVQLGIPGGKRADLDGVPMERIRTVLEALRAAHVRRLPAGFRGDSPLAH